MATFGHLKLRELGDKHYDDVRSWGRTATVGYVARKMLNDAIEDKKLARGMNPLSNLGRGKGRGRADITIITEAELYELACAILALGSDFGPARPRQPAGARQGQRLRTPRFAVQTLDGEAREVV